MTYYEIKKVFSKKGSKVALIFIFIVISVVLSFIIGDNKYVNRNGDAESGISAMLKVRELKKEWSGELTEDVLRKIIEENVRISQTPEAKSNDFRQNDIAYSQRQGFMDIRDLLNCDYGEFNDYNYYLADSLSPDEAVDFYSNRIKNLKNWLETDGKDQFSEKEKSYLIRAYEKMKTPLYYDYQAGWKNLFQYSPSIIMILTLVLGFLCAGIFSGEFQLKANAVFYSSYYGRNKAVWAKVKAGAIIITAIYWAVMLLYTMLVLGILGVDGANCPIQSRGSENIGKILLLSFKDSEEEIIESVLAALKTGRNIYCDEKNINPLKIHYGDIVILLATRELFRKQKKIDLSFTEFEILHLLMRSPGRVFSKEQIYDIIWNEPYSGDYNVVMRHICNIREKIEDDPGHPVYIQTVRGVGYRFNGNLGSE